eukprot:14755214-Alexandrium_andersonii.AAC.1
MLCSSQILLSLAIAAQAWREFTTPAAWRGPLPAQVLHEAEALVQQGIHLALLEVPAARDPVELRAPQEGEDGHRVAVVLRRVDWRRRLQ